MAGYQPLMPTFQGQVTEEGVLQLIEYIKSLAPPATGAGTTPAEINVNPGAPPPRRSTVSHMNTAAIETQENYLNASYGLK